MKISYNMLHAMLLYAKDVAPSRKDYPEIGPAYHIFLNQLIYKIEEIEKYASGSCCIEFRIKGEPK